LFQKFKTTSSTLRASAAVSADPKRDFYRDYHRTITSLGLDGRLKVALRVLVSVRVDNAAAGVPREEILRNYAALANPDIDAALAFAAGLTRQGTLDLPLEIKA